MVALGDPIATRKENWGPDSKPHHMSAIKLFPLCGIAYIHVVGVRMSRAKYKSLHIIICYLFCFFADQQSLFNFLEQYIISGPEDIKGSNISPQMLQNPSQLVSALGTFFSLFSFAKFLDAAV